MRARRYQMKPRPFIFVDRDGTLLEDPGYLHRIEDYAPITGALEGLRALQEAGFGIAIVTNQSGIARGYFSESEFHRFQEHVVADFKAHGVRISATYFCPHDPEDGCSCRKPGTGMLEQAQSDFNVEMQVSWMIGDKPEDMELARRAGCQGIYVLTGEGPHRRRELPPEFPVARDMVEASQHILAAKASPDISPG
jgi:D-glycero-D-manno-heptose 1,7-bisphosphate phosphatase